MLRRMLGRGVESRAIDASDFNVGSLTDLSKSTSGINVTEDSALTLSAFFGSIRILSEGVAGLPVDSFQRVEGTRRPFRPKPGWLVEPSHMLTWHEFMGQMMISVLIHGNAFAAVLRDGNGQIDELSPLAPDAIHKVTVVPGHGLLYETVDGTQFTQKQILHVPGMMHAGSHVGMSVLSYARETLGLGLAAQRFGSTFFSNGGTPKIVVTTPDKLTPAGVQTTKRAWREAHSGDKANDIAVLSEGASFEMVSVPPDDAQFLETRGFQVADVARFFGVPPHLLADATGSTSWGSGLAEQSTNYVTHSLNPWVNRFEGRLSKMLRSDQLGRSTDGAFVKLNVSGLQRGDHPTRWDTHRANAQAGVMTVNEIRRIEDMVPVEGGDELLRPLNLAPADAPPEPENDTPGGE